MCADEHRLEMALELEERQFIKEANRLADEARDQSLRLRSEFTKAGHGPVSTPLWGALLRLEMERLDQMVQIAAKMRRENCRTVPELGYADQLTAWRQRIENWSETEFWSLPSRIAEFVRVQDDQIRKFMLDSGTWVAQLSRIKADAVREAEMILREVALGMHAQSEPKYTVHFAGPVGAVNLGTIQGDMNTAIGSLIQEKGGEEVAEALKRLAEAVAAAEELGDQRAEMLEGLAIITQEAARPPEQRKGQFVRSLLERWAPVLTATGALAEIWNAAYPLLRAWFGWP